jgi:hypothetical protein
MRIKHLNENSKMRFRLLNESAYDHRSQSRPIARIAVDGTFFVDLTMQDIAEILAQGGLKTQDFYVAEPIGEEDKNII